MKKKLYISVAAALLLAGCDYNDKYFDGLEELTKPVNVIKENYTLTEADYAKISDHKTNQAIAKEAGQEKALGYVKNDHYFTEKVPAATYLPAFLADKYYTADDGSSVMVTFGYKENKSQLLSDYSSIKIYTPSNKMYTNIYGNTGFAPYLNEATKGKVIDLLSGYEDPQDGDVVFVDYRLSKGDATSDLLELPMLWQNFEGIATGKLTSLKDWFNGGDWFVSSKGGTDWKVTSYDANQYVQYSANNTKGECEAWLITPAVSIGPNDKLSFDVAVGHYNADCLSVLMSTNFDGSNVDAAKWTDITSEFTIPREPTKGYGKFASAGEYSMNGHDGHNVRIAFKYVGDGANKKTTTYQIDNVMIGAKIPAKGGLNSEPVYALKVYNKGKWEDNQNKKVYMLAYEDYIKMGVSSLNFTAEKPAVNYIPKYLDPLVAYPVDGDTRVVVYRYNNGDKTNIRSDEYVFSSEAYRWVLKNNIVNNTEQYVLNEGKWNFDPSTVIDLKADKSDAESTAFYTAIVNWVKDNQNEYFDTSHNNNEYYYGASFYQNNFDFRISKWKDYYPGKSEDEIKKLMWDRLPKAFMPALESIYKDVDVVPGIEVIYTLNFAVYEGTNPAPTYTIKYKVTGKGKFEYIADSLQKQE